jgi:hypothetical protein
MPSLNTKDVHEAAFNGVKKLLSEGIYYNKNSKYVVSTLMSILKYTGDLKAEFTNNEEMSRLVEDAGLFLLSSGKLNEADDVFSINNSDKKIDDYVMSVAAYKGFLEQLKNGGFVNNPKGLFAMFSKKYKITYSMVDTNELRKA